MITFFILLVASLADEAANLEFARMHSDPAEGFAVVFYSKDFRYTKLADPGRDNGKAFFEAADASTQNLFILDNDRGDEWFIRDAVSNNRLGCSADADVVSIPSSSTIDDSQLWKFIGPDADGFYRIENVKRGWQIGVGNPTAGGCINPLAADGHFKWRLEDIFKATAMWKTIAELDNQSGVEGKYTYKKTVGYTQSITKSEAKKKSVSQSLHFSAGGSLGPINLGAESDTQLSKEFSESVSNAMSGKFTVEETLSWPVPAKTCLQIQQIQIMQEDTMADIENMAFYASKTKIQECPGHSRSRSNMKSDCMTKWGGVWEYGNCLMNVEAEETSTVAVAQQSSNVDTFVNIFAVVGFGVVAFGAFRHFTKA